MWKGILCCSLFLVLSGYCFAEFVQTPSICEPEKTINAELIPEGAKLQTPELVEYCKRGGSGVGEFAYVEYLGIKTIAGVTRRRWACWWNLNGNYVQSGGIAVELNNESYKYHCPSGFELKGTQCVKPKTCKCPNDTDWVLGQDATYCYKDEPSERGDYCKERANGGYDVKLGVTQGGCYNVAGLPAAQGCFFAYKDKVCLIAGGEGTSLAECGPGVENTGVLCTIDKETDPEDPEKPKPGDGGSESSNPDGEGKGDGDGDGKGDGDKGNGEASSGEGEGNGGTGGNGNSEDGGKCPSWAKGVCDFFGWDGDSKLDDPGTGGLPGGGNGTTEEITIDTSDKFMGAGSCPAPQIVSINLGNGGIHNLEIPYDYVCRFAEMMRPLFVLFSMLMAGRILFASK